MEEGADITNFRSLKYETRIDAKKMQVEELVLNKMGKWKYSPDQLASHISNELLERLKPRWELAMQTTRDIYEKTLRRLLLSITNDKVKESMKKNEEKMTLRFNTCLILLKDIEHVVNNSIEM